jgi:hypothetical protein
MPTPKPDSDPQDRPHTLTGPIVGLPTLLRTWSPGPEPSVPGEAPVNMMKQVEVLSGKIPLTR